METAGVGGRYIIESVTLELKIISLADSFAEKSADNSVHSGNYPIGISIF